MNTEIYTKSDEIGNWLIKILRVEEGSHTSSKLRKLYQGIVWYEQGKVKITPSAHKKQFNRLLRYFTRAIKELKKKNKQVALYEDHLLQRIELTDRSGGIWDLYELLRKIKH